MEGSDSSRFRLGIFKSISLLDRRAEKVGWYDVVLKGVDGENSRSVWKQVWQFCNGYGPQQGAIWVCFCLFFRRGLTC